MNSSSKEKNEMNAQIVPVEIEGLSYLPAATLLKLVEATQKANKNAAAFKKTVMTFPAIFRKFEELDLTVRFDLDNSYITVSFTGTGDLLGQVWGTLRTAGFNTSTRPKKGDTTFYAFWNQEGFADIFMNFSSSVCRRVQIGTETKEVPIYETQCGDLPELDPPANAVATMESANDIPF